MPRLTAEPLAVTPLVIAVRADSAVRVAHIGQSATTLPLRPTTRRTVAASEQVAVFARVIGTSSGAVKGELRVREGDAIVRMTPVRLVAAKAPDARLGSIDSSTRGTATESQRLDHLDDGTLLAGMRDKHDVLTDSRHGFRLLAWLSENAGCVDPIR